MAQELEPQHQWRDPTPSSSLASYESGEPVTPRATKKCCTEEEQDPTYNPQDKAESERAPNQDTESIPLVPRTLVFKEEQERDPEPPAPSTATSTNKAAGDKPKLRRGEHGRHKSHDDVHVILMVGLQGEPLLPITVLNKFSNQCSSIVREKVKITYENWTDVPEDLKEHVWKEMVRRFTYLEDADMDKCREWVMHVAGRAHRNFKYMLNRDYLKKGKTPCIKYNMVLHEDWEVFTRQRQSIEAKAKSERFTALVKRNQHPTTWA